MAQNQNPALYLQQITILPLQPISNQTSTFTINGENYSFASYWNDLKSCWFVDIYNASTDKLLAAGIRLVADVDLLQAFRELKRAFNACLVCIELNTSDYMAFDNLGSFLLLGLVTSAPTYIAPKDTVAII